MHISSSSTLQFVVMTVGTGSAAKVTYSYVAVSDTGTATPVSGEASIVNTSSPVVVMPIPPVGTTYVLKSLTVALDGTVTVPSDVRVGFGSGAGGTFNNSVFNGTLAPGCTCTYNEASGFNILSESGQVSIQTNRKNSDQRAYFSKYFQQISSGAATSMVSGQVYTTCIGECNSRSLFVNVGFKLAAAAAGVSWAEVAVFRSNVMDGAQPTFEYLGSTSVAGVVTTPGFKYVNVVLSKYVREGDVLHVGVGMVAAPMATLRNRGGADQINDLHSNAFVSMRPSLAEIGSRYPSSTMGTLDFAIIGKVG